MVAGGNLKSCQSKKGTTKGRSMTGTTTVNLRVQTCADKRG